MLVGHRANGRKCDAGSPLSRVPDKQGRTAEPGEWARRAGLERAVITALALFGMTDIAHAAGGLGGEVDAATYQLMVFVIAVFVGYYVVWGVTPALHTPLMSLTNAVSSVIVVGALLATGVGATAAGSGLAKLLGFFALAMVSVNIFGGFLVTQRMLGMYKRKKEAKE